MHDHSRHRLQRFHGLRIASSDFTRKHRVGVPATEGDNESQCQRGHDIRKLKINVRVFRRFNGSGPVRSEENVLLDIQRARERFAQATIEIDFNVDMGPGGNGVMLPASLQDGDFVVGQIDPNTDFHLVFSQDELDVITERDGDENSIDVFYIEVITGLSARAHSYTATGAAPASSQAGVMGTNWIIVEDDPKPFTLAHELMHILLDSGHRSGEHLTSLFLDGTSDTPAVDGTKRIGPNAATAAGAPGESDTTTLRNNAEDLP